MTQFYTKMTRQAGRLEEVLGFARSHFIVTRGSVSHSCATTQHPSRFSISQRYINIITIKIRKYFQQKQYFVYQVERLSKILGLFNSGSNFFDAILLSNFRAPHSENQCSVVL